MSALLNYTIFIQPNFFTFSSFKGDSFDMVSAVVFQAVLVVVTGHSSVLFFFEDAISGNNAFSLVEDISISDVTGKFLISLQIACWGLASFNIGFTTLTILFSVVL